MDRGRAQRLPVRVTRVVGELDPIRPVRDAVAADHIRASAQIADRQIRRRAVIEPDTDRDRANDRHADTVADGVGKRVRVGEAHRWRVKDPAAIAHHRTPVGAARVGAEKSERIAIRIRTVRQRRIRVHRIPPRVS